VLAAFGRCAPPAFPLCRARRVLGPCSAAAQCAVVASLIVVAACARSCARLPARAMGKATLRGVRTACILHDTGVAITARTRAEVGSAAVSEPCWSAHIALRRCGSLLHYALASACTIATYTRFYWRPSTRVTRKALNSLLNANLLDLRKASKQP
jgi:hypothetical protein